MLRFSATTRALLLAGLAALPIGCVSGPEKAAVLQKQNRALVQQNKAQQAELAKLRAHARQIEDELLVAEQQVAAALVGNTAGGIRPALAARGAASPVGGQLALLAAEHNFLHYDPQTGIAKVDTEILFDSGEAKLKPAAQQRMRELVAVLKSPVGRDLKVMVAGHTDDMQIKGAEARELYPTNWHLSTARANAVADALRSYGLDGQRMGVAGFGQFQSLAANSSPQARQQNRRVEIFLTAPDVPVVGMTETLTNLY
jgi:chemotaxis protein MotB